MKKILQAIILLASVFFLVACGDKTPDLDFPAPENVEINGDVLTWSAVTDAESYLVYIDARSIEVNGTTFNLADEPMTVGDHLIYVVAVKGESFSLPSTVLTYTVVALANPATIVSAIIEQFDIEYETGMSESDFSSLLEYEAYQNSMDIAQAYANATSNVRMSESDAIGFFGDFMQMAQSEDIETLNGLMDEMEMFETYHMTPYATAYVLYNVSLVRMDEEVYDAFTDNEEVVVQSLELVIDYLMTIKNSIPQNVISAVDNYITNDVLTHTEVFLIKDEMVTILIDTLPSENDFTLLYTAMFYVIGTITGEDMSGYSEHASYLAEVLHLEIDIFLSMLDDITLVMIQDIKAIVDEMFIVYDPMLIPNHEEKELDYKKTVELVLYIANYIDDFKTANSVKFEQLDTLMQDDSAEALFGIAIDNVIAQIEQDEYISLAEKTELISMLNAYKLEYDTIVSAQHILKDIGLDVFDEFIETEASLIMNILTLNELETITQTQMIILINDIIDDLISLNSIVMGQLDQADFQILLDFMKTPITFVFPMMYGMPSIDYNTIYSGISPYLAELLANAVVIEQALINNLGTLDISSIFDSTSSSMMTMMLPPLFEVLNKTLTPANETLIMDSIDIIFDDIFKQEYLLNLYGSTIEEIDAMKLLVIDEANFYIDEIQIISTWDLTNLTTEQQGRVGSLVMIIIDLFSPDTNETNPMFADAIPIFQNQKQTNYMTEHGEYFFEFVPEYSRLYYISVNYSGNSSYPSLVIYNENGDEITNSSFANHLDKVYYCTQEIDLYAGEVYYIGIYGEPDVPFAIEVVNPIDGYTSQYDSALPLLINDPNLVEFDFAYTAKWYTFTPETSGLYDIYSLNDSLNDPYLVILDTNLSFMNQYDDEAENNNFYASEVSLLGGQTYYIILGSYSDETTGYSVIITPSNPS